MTYEQLQAANATIKTTSIKGKPYAEVNQRIKAFRMVFPEGFIRTHLLSDENGVCKFAADVGYYDNGNAIVLGTGTAFESKSSSFINKESYIENCETSAVGRALGMAGFGIDTAVCSAEELMNAMLNQNDTEQNVTKQNDTKQPQKDGLKTADYADGTLLCPKCGKPVLKEYSKKDKIWLEPKDVLEKCGGVCYPCFKQQIEEAKKEKENRND